MGIFHLSLQNVISFSFSCFLLLFIFFIRAKNRWHFLSVSEIGLIHKIIIVITLIITILISILPMSLSPYWNGSMVLKADKQMYDRLGDALLKGRLYIDDGTIDPILETMPNPYDPVERKRLGLYDYHWDEAYYNHHLYMYFGVMPAVLLFIPFKLITGKALLSYQATQIFASLTIIGIFYLFYILCKKYYPKFPFSQYLLLSSSFSILSIGYSIAAPALYCTAIIAGICLMVWSINCFFQGAWIEKNNKNSALYLFVGSFLGALAFGCRPPLALANLVVTVVIWQAVHNSNNNKSDKIIKFVLIVFPYFVVGVILMLYNYARFDNVFEFGQTYQLTIADQHNYNSFLERFDTKQLLEGLLCYFCFDYEVMYYLLMNASAKTFPFIYYNGVFISFPILLLSAKIFSRDIADNLKKKGLYSLTMLFFFLPFLIVLFDVYWAPYVLERYKLDFYYLLCIASFTAIAALFETIPENKKKYLLCFLTVLIFTVFVVEFLLFCIPYDGSYTFWYPEVLDVIYKGLCFGL